MMGKGIQSGYEFGPFRLDTVKRCLLRDGETVSLQPKDFETLLVLVRERERVVEKEELIEALWPDTFVEEANLSQHIYVIRKALGDVAQNHAYIVTVSGRGYRFVAPVTEWREEDEELILAERTRTHLVIEEQEEGQEDKETGRQGERAIFSRRGRAAAVAAVLVGLTAVLAWWWMGGGPERGAMAEIKSVAVLPFKPLQSGGNDEYLGLGLADTLITKLSGIRQLIVRPVSAMRKYSSPEQDPLTAGREQRVDAVLDSNLQRDGERIRITARLLRVEDGSALWTYQCDERYCADLFAMQDVISEKVAAALMRELTGEERKSLRKHYTENREAQELYLKGRYFVSRGANTSVKKGVECFTQAVGLDPNYALAHAGLANAFFSLGRGAYTSPGEAMPKARAAALQALALDDSLAEAYVSLAQVKTTYDLDWAGAEAEYRRALELNPNLADAHHWYGRHLSAQGRVTEALAELNHALRLDPISLPISVSLGEVFYYARQYQAAIRQMQKVLEMDPNYPYARWAIGRAYLQQAKYREAADVLQEELHGKPNPPLQSELAAAYAAMGKRDEALKLLAEIEAFERQRYVGPLNYATIHLSLGDKDRAFAWLEKAYEMRATRVHFLKVEPAYDRLHSDPRFTDLLRRMGLAP